MRNFLRLGAGALLLCGLLLTQAAVAEDNLFRGCLVGTDDNYVLRTVDGELYRLHSDKDLDEHVGNTVEVAGKIEQNERDQQAQKQADIARQVGVDIPTKGINVQDVKSAAKGCADVVQAMQSRSQGGSAMAASGGTTGVAAGASVGTSEQQIGVGAQAGVAAPAGAAAADSSGQVVREEGAVRGCLTGTDDNYVLKAEDGKLYRLHSDKDIDEHVGNTVMVRGKIEQNEREQQAQTQAGVAAQAGVDIPTMGINVEDLRTVSKGCVPAPRQ